MADERNPYDHLLDLAYAAGMNVARLEDAVGRAVVPCLRAHVEVTERHLPRQVVERFEARVRDEVFLDDCIRPDVAAAISEVLDRRDAAREIAVQGERPCTHAEHLTAASKARCSAVGLAAAHQTLEEPIEEQVARAVVDGDAIHGAVDRITKALLNEEGERRFRASIRREIHEVGREIRDDVLATAHARRFRRAANLDRRTRARARGRRPRTAARRAAGSRSGNDPGDPDPPSSSGPEPLNAGARLRTSSPHPLRTASPRGVRNPSAAEGGRTQPLPRRRP